MHESLIAKRQGVHNKLSRAVKYGKIKKPTCCQRCGKGSLLDGHHPDYSKPLEVVWLCRKCHRMTHEARIYSKTPFVMAKRNEGQRVFAFDIRINKWRPAIITEIYYRKRRSHLGYELIYDVQFTDGYISKHWEQTIRLTSKSKFLRGKPKKTYSYK